MRTRGKGEGLIEQNENMRFGWALPNTPFLRYPHLNHWIFPSSLFTFPSYSPLALSNPEASGVFIPVKSVNISIWSLVLPRLSILSRKA